MSVRQPSSGWRTVRFGDVVRNVDEAVRDPQTCDLERFVGLEHIDPESLRIKRWGLIAGGTSFTRRFAAGQVLFGKRRAYQRKVAVADFEGLCSSDILVFEPADDRLLPELLAFIVQTEGFFQHALGTSSGSLSPRTRWRDLAAYEFPLPPLDEQRRIAEILWAAEDVRIRLEETCSALDELKAALVSALIAKGIHQPQLAPSPIGDLPAHWQARPLGDLLVMCQYGLSIPLSDHGEYPIFRMMNLEDGKVVANDMKFVDLEDADIAIYRVEQGDILFNRTNSADLVGKVGIFQLEGNYVFASYLLRLRVDPTKVRPEYLNCYLNSKEGQARIAVYATPGVSQSNINASNLQKLIVPVPPLSEQDVMISQNQRVETARTALMHHQARLRDTRKLLMGSLLGQM